MLLENYLELYRLIKSHAYKEADPSQPFKLASGKESLFYVDCKQVMLRPEALWSIGRLFFEQIKNFKNKNLDFNALGGMAMGAVPLCTAVSMVAYQNQKPMPILVARKDVKAHGTGAKLEGLAAFSKDQSEKIILLEDTVTTGGSTLKAANAYREAGYQIDTVLSLIDRQEGGAQNLKDNGMAVHALYTLEDLRAGEELCQQAFEKRFQQITPQVL